MVREGRLNGGPKIDLYCLCWNEARIIPFFLRHYLPLVDRVFVYDNGSTDQSVALLSGDERIHVAHFDVTGDSFVEEERWLSDRIWKVSRGSADWVAVMLSYIAWVQPILSSVAKTPVS